MPLAKKGFVDKMSLEAFIDGIARGFYLPELRRCRCEKVRVWSFLDEEAVKRRLLLGKENNFTIIDKEVIFLPWV